MSNTIATRKRQRRTRRAPHVSPDFKRRRFLLALGAGGAGAAAVATELARRVRWRPAYGPG